MLELNRCYCMDCMNNDAFYRLYGFSFNPYKYHGLYELARERVHGAEQEVCRMQSGWTGV